MIYPSGHTDHHIRQLLAKLAFAANETNLNGCVLRIVVKNFETCLKTLFILFIGLTVEFYLEISCIA